MNPLRTNSSAYYVGIQGGPCSLLYGVAKQIDYCTAYVGLAEPQTVHQEALSRRHRLNRRVFDLKQPTLGLGFRV